VIPLFSGILPTFHDCHYPIPPFYELPPLASRPRVALEVGAKSVPLLAVGLPKRDPATFCRRGVCGPPEGHANGCSSPVLITFLPFLSRHLVAKLSPPPPFPHARHRGCWSSGSHSRQLSPLSPCDIGLTSPPSAHPECFFTRVWPTGLPPLRVKARERFCTAQRRFTSPPSLGWAFQSSLSC